MKVRRVRMTRLVALLVLLVLVFSVDAWSFRYLKNALSRSSERSKRVTDCNEAYRELQNPRVEQCTDYLSESEISDNQLNRFCGSQHCVSILKRVFNDIYVYCNDQVSELFLLL